MVNCGKSAMSVATVIAVAAITQHQPFTLIDALWFWIVFKVVGAIGGLLEVWILTKPGGSNASD